MKVSFSGVPQEISDAFSYVGLCRDKEYLERQKNSLLKAAEGCKNSAPEKSAVLFATAKEIEKISDEV